jgi:hypothetical protein
LTTDLNLDRTARSSRRHDRLLASRVILGLALSGRMTEESKKF